MEEEPQYIVEGRENGMAAGGPATFMFAPPSARGDFDQAAGWIDDRISMRFYMILSTGQEQAVTKKG
jgi:hypothetical protein